MDVKHRKGAAVYHNGTLFDSRTRNSILAVADTAKPCVMLQFRLESKSLQYTITPNCVDLHARHMYRYSH